MSNNELIWSAAIRAAAAAGLNWQTTPSADLAVLCLAPAAWQPCTLVVFFNEIIVRGDETTVSELAQIYKYGQLVADVRNALERGAVDELNALAALLPYLLTLTQPTLDAITETLAAHTLRLIDVVALEREEEAPETVTAADVDLALGR